MLRIRPWFIRAVENMISAQNRNVDDDGYTKLLIHVTRFSSRKLLSLWDLLEQTYQIEGYTNFS